jgi:GNAT superfamily N-acetyltransferase
MAIAAGSHAAIGAIHRLATFDDAVRLFEIRRQSIRELACAGMTVEQVDAWAARLSLAGMELKLRELEIWVAEFDGTVVGWGAIRGDCLEGLYISPEFAGRGVGAGLLAMLEGLMHARGFRAACAEASSNAREFYLRRGYRSAGPQTPEGAWPIAKPLS